MWCVLLLWQNLEIDDNQKQLRAKIDKIDGIMPPSPNRFGGFLLPNLFPRAMRKIAMLAGIFNECREVFDFNKKYDKILLRRIKTTCTSKNQGL